MMKNTNKNYLKQSDHDQQQSMMNFNAKKSEQQQKSKKPTNWYLLYLSGSRRFMFYACFQPGKLVLWSHFWAMFVVIWTDIDRNIDQCYFYTGPQICQLLYSFGLCRAS